MSHGFVYVLSNESMPNIYKIGFTFKHPKDRMAELSAATACPTRFELLAYIGCQHPQIAEGGIHSALNEYRVNASREFFAAPLLEIQSQLRCWGSNLDDAFYLEPLDFLVEKERNRGLQCATTEK